MDNKERREQLRFKVDKKISKKEMQQLKDDYVDELGRKFKLFLEYDQDALVRLAIADYNFKNPHHFISMRAIKRIVDNANASPIPKDAKKIFSLNNPGQRYKGLHILLGEDYNLIKRNSTVLGRMVRFCQDVQHGHFSIA